MNRTVKKEANRQLMQRLLTLIVLEQSRAREKTTRREREAELARPCSCERERASERREKRESRKEKGVFRSFRNGRTQKERNETKRLIDVR